MAITKLIIEEEKLHHWCPVWNQKKIKWHIGKIKYIDFCNKSDECKYKMEEHDDGHDELKYVYLDKEIMKNNKTKKVY